MKPIIIEIDVSAADGNRGPASFSRGLKELLPFRTSKCIFKASKRISIKNSKHKSDFFYSPTSVKDFDKWVKKKVANKLIFGPNFVPFCWYNFPDKKILRERRFREILSAIKGIVVHSDRVKNHLSKRSNTSDIISRFKIVRPCTNLEPKIINNFYNRSIDILIFEKYADLDRRKQALQLINLFKNTNKKIEKIIYGNYTKEQMEELANNSKFIIYFSFFDTGAIGLKEIQNYGVFAFSHQKDLIINKMTSFFIPELSNEYDMRPAFNKIMKIIRNVSKNHPNSEQIGKINQKINKCQNALDEICKIVTL